MKKIITVLAIALCSKSASAQIFGQTKIQDEANSKLAYVFRYLVSDTMILKNFMLKDTTMKLCLMSDGLGKPLYALMSREDFNSCNESITTFAKEGILQGVEFNLTYLEEFSWQKRGIINSLKDPYQKKMTKVFNSKVKYLVMQKSAGAVKGKRILDEKNANYGQIVPDFGTSTSTQPADDTPKGTKALENKTETKNTSREVVPLKKTTVPEPFGNKKGG